MRSPLNGGPLDSLDPLDPGDSIPSIAPAPVDVPPSVRCEVVETVGPEELEPESESEAQAVLSPFPEVSVPSEAAASGELENSGLGAKDWCVTETISFNVSAHLL